MEQTCVTEKPVGVSLVHWLLSGRGEDAQLSKRREEDILTLRVIGRPGGGDTGGAGGPRLTAHIAGHRSERFACADSVNRRGNPPWQPGCQGPVRRSPLLLQVKTPGRRPGS